MTHKAIKFIGNIVALIIMAFVQAFFVEMLWPGVMVKIFGMREISYWEAFRIVMFVWLFNFPKLDATK